MSQFDGVDLSNKFSLNNFKEKPRWVARINIWGVYFDSIPGTQAQAEESEKLAKETGLQVCVIDLADQ